MNCNKCGSLLSPGDKFCNTCGAQVLQEQPIINQVSTQMPMEMNNIQPEVATQQHPLMMNQSDINSMQPSEIPTMVQSENSMNVGTNSFVSSNNSIQSTQQPVMNGNMGMNNMVGVGTNNQAPYGMVPPTTTGMGAMGAQQKTPGNSKLMLVGVAIAVVILIGIFVFVSKGNVLNEKEIGQAQQEQEVPTYTVKINGFSFKVPQTYIYEVNNGYLLLYDETDSWILRLSVQKISYETLKTNMGQLKSTAEKKGYKAEQAELKTLNGVEIIKFNFEASGIKYSGGYTKINSMYLATIEGFNQDNTYDEDLLKKAASIIKTAEYTGDTNNMAITIPDAVLSLIEQ